ncbi:XRE family transcriptional regulator [Moraxella catarrhalis]|uniref:helix-turn-helix domain-containing protein n=2 Tax=Moraxella catarrhalis TaxID=480 RepID=UPI000202A0B8|nr:helix-turn-helix transcriptional regulator [Moraxella catarrhalis]EGE21779.1 helix-turn-helix domain-containing protein [Moraxella catarrhalis BC7]MPW58040.1 XRE family transcriptional regulator [Moraxella catarrhalis]MPW61107.1 XRE family transcriptional regulator [Moraxella catarrhalis]MPW70668.1 XRE family transcriptional regulator [Moraxella catarrhalis]MPX12159.1 XRE family transcriptional regulator [Moraxella catarrhalis]
MKTIEKICFIREKQNLTQEQMANELGLSTNGYANLERSETRLSVDRLEQIANIFGVGITELMTSDENNTIMVYHSTSTSNLNIFSNASESMLEAEIARLQLIISHKDELLEQQKREIETIKFLVENFKVRN